MIGNTLLDARKLLRECGVAPGMHVADFGCGMAGHMVLPASLMVGENGRVYAVDIMPKTLESLQGRLASGGHLNTDIIWGDFEREGGVQIEAGTLDRIFFVNNLWVVNDLRAVLREMRRLLNPGGRILIVDWSPRTESQVAPPLAHRTDVMEVMRHLAGEGFQGLYDFGAGEHHWGIQASLDEKHANS